MDAILNAARLSTPPDANVVIATPSDSLDIISSTVPDICQDIWLDNFGERLDYSEPVHSTGVPAGPPIPLPEYDEYPDDAITFEKCSNSYGLPYNDHNYTSKYLIAEHEAPQSDHLSLLAKVALAKDENFITTTDIRSSNTSTCVANSEQNKPASIKPDNALKSLNRTSDSHLLITDAPLPSSNRVLSSSKICPQQPSRANPANTPLQVHRITSSLTPHIILRTSTPALQINTSNNRYPNNTTVHCGCGRVNSSSSLLQCTSCRTWQHFDCAPLPADGMLKSPYICDGCFLSENSPRKADHLSLTTSQPQSATSIRIQRSSLAHNLPTSNITGSNNFGSIIVNSPTTLLQSPLARKINLCVANGLSQNNGSPVVIQRQDTTFPVISLADASRCPVSLITAVSSSNALQHGISVRVSKRKQDLVNLTGFSSSDSTDLECVPNEPLQAPPTTCKADDVDRPPVVVVSKPDQQSNRSSSSLQRLLLMHHYSTPSATSTSTPAVNSVKPPDPPPPQLPLRSPTSANSTSSQLDFLLTTSKTTSANGSSASTPAFKYATSLRLTARLRRQFDLLRAAAASSLSSNTSSSYDPRLDLPVNFTCCPPRCKVSTFSFNHKGLVATRDLEIGEPILEYRGECMLMQEYCETCDIRKHFNPYVLFYKGIPRLSLCVDARDCGNEARFIRRSCMPNCEVRHSVTFSEKLVSYQLSLMLFTADRVSSQSELTLPFDFDYTVCRYLVNCPCNRKSCLVQRALRPSDAPHTPLPPIGSAASRLVTASSSTNSLHTTAPLTDDLSLSSHYNDDANGVDDRPRLIKTSGRSRRGYGKRGGYTPGSSAAVFNFERSGSPSYANAWSTGRSHSTKNKLSTGVRRGRGRGRGSSRIGLSSIKSLLSGSRISSTSTAANRPLTSSKRGRPRGRRGRGVAATSSSTSRKRGGVKFSLKGRFLIKFDSPHSELDRSSSPAASKEDRPSRSPSPVPVLSEKSPDRFSSSNRSSSTKRRRIGSISTTSGFSSPIACDDSVKQHQQQPIRMASESEDTEPECDDSVVSVKCRVPQTPPSDDAISPIKQLQSPQSPVRNRVLVAKEEEHIELTRKFSYDDSKRDIDDSLTEKKRRKYSEPSPLTKKPQASRDETKQSREDIWMAEVMRRIERMEKKQRRSNGSRKVSRSSVTVDPTAQDSKKKKLSPSASPEHMKIDDIASPNQQQTSSSDDLPRSRGSGDASETSPIHVNDASALSFGAKSRRRRSQTDLLSDSLSTLTGDLHGPRERRWLQSQLQRITTDDSAPDEPLVSKSAKREDEEYWSPTETDFVKTSPSCSTKPHDHANSPGRDCDLIVYRAHEKDPMAKFSRNRSRFPDLAYSQIQAAAVESHQPESAPAVVEEMARLPNSNNTNNNPSSSIVTSPQPNTPRPSKKRWLSQALMENGDDAYKPTPINPKKRLIFQFSESLDEATATQAPVNEPNLFEKLIARGPTTGPDRLATPPPPLDETPSFLAATPTPPQASTQNEPSSQQQHQHQNTEEMGKVKVSLTEYRRRMGLSCAIEPSSKSNSNLAIPPPPLLQLSTAGTRPLREPHLDGADVENILFPDHPVLPAPIQQHQKLLSDLAPTPPLFDNLGPKLPSDPRPPFNDYLMTSMLDLPRHSYQRDLEEDERGPRTPSDPPDDDDEDGMEEEVSEQRHHHSPRTPVSTEDPPQPPEPDHRVRTSSGDLHERSVSTSAVVRNGLLPTPPEHLRRRSFDYAPESHRPSLLPVPNTAADRLPPTQPTPAPYGRDLDAGQVDYYIKRDQRVRQWQAANCSSTTLTSATNLNNPLQLPHYYSSVFEQRREVSDSYVEQIACVEQALGRVTDSLRHELTRTRMRHASSSQSPLGRYSDSRRQSQHRMNSPTA